MIPIRISVYERGLAGVPTATLYANLHEKITSYRHSISDQYGYETMSVSLVCSLEDANDWLSNGLMRPGVATGPDGGVIWEGFLHSVELRAGQESRGVSLDNMANRLKCKYSLTNGTPGTSSVTTDARSIALFGTKDLIISLGNTTATGAASKAARVLSIMKYPRATGSINVSTGDVGGIELTLSFVGWYATLGWVVTSRASETVTSTTTQVGTLLGTGVGIQAVNNFILSSTAGIVASGISDTEYIETDTSYQDKIEALLEQGNSSGFALAWGVYDNRQFFVEVAADSAPTTTHYVRSLGEGVVRDTSGAHVNAWDVRPNRMYAARELLDLNPSDIAPDAGGTSYISRVSCAVDRSGVSLDLEGRTGESIDRIVARIR